MKDGSFDYDNFIFADSKASNFGPAPWNPPLRVPSTQKSSHQTNTPPQATMPSIQKNPKLKPKRNFGKIILGFLRSISFLWLLALVFAVLAWIGQNSAWRCGAALRVCYFFRFICEVDRTVWQSNIAPLCRSIQLVHMQNPAEDCVAFQFFPPRPKEPRPADLQNLRNYASSGANATIISEFTSPTHGLPKISTFDYFKHKFLSTPGPKILIPPPFVILEDSIEDGDCWRISGSTGQVGIRLSVPIVITHVSFDYISPIRLSPSSLASAPKKMSLWALVDDIPKSTELDSLTKHPVTEFLVRGTIDTHGFFVWLADLQYNIFGPATLQQFNIHHDPPIRTQVVVLRVESNEGGNTTCIYWLGIHGLE